jgi:hypothetical protein
MNITVMMLVEVRLDPLEDSEPTTRSSYLQWQ